MKNLNKERLTGDIGQRLREIMAEKKIGVTQIARECEAKRPTVTEWVAGRNPQPLWFIVRFCETYGIFLTWMATGNGPKYVIDFDQLDYDIDDMLSFLLENPDVERMLFEFVVHKAAAKIKLHIAGLNQEFPAAKEMLLTSMKQREAMSEFVSHIKNEGIQIKVPDEQKVSPEYY
jgi:hypothetical protein